MKNNIRTIWMTGLSGSGKTTLAKALRRELEKTGRVVLLDGDQLRKGISSGLGFSNGDRAEHLRRIAHIAKLTNQSGCHVIVACISPKESMRKEVSRIVGDPFRLVYLNAPLEVCEARDPKGLYAKARAGLIPNMTGIGSEYEAPADCIQIAPNKSVGQAAEMVLKQAF